MATVTLKGGTVLEVEHLPADAGADRQGWVAVTVLELNPDTGKVEPVARWIDTAQIESVAG